MTWTKVNIGTTAHLTAVATVDSYFVVVGQNGTVAISARDGGALFVSDPLP